MAKRHVIDYCNKINLHYNEFLCEIKELEKLCTEYTVSPDTIEQMKSIFEPLKSLWTNSNYYLYLLKSGKPFVKKWYEDCKKELLESTTDLNDAQKSEISQPILDNLQAIYETSYQKYRSATWFRYLFEFPNRKKKEPWYLKNTDIDVWNPFTYNNSNILCEKCINKLKKLNESISHKE